MLEEHNESLSVHFSDHEMKRTLLSLSGYTAWCCGFANRMPDGSIVETTDNFHLDHVIPKSKGGSPTITNRAPLCANHNTRKGNKWVALHDLRQEIVERGELRVDKVEDLIDLGEAYDKTLEIYVDARIEQRVPTIRIVTTAEYAALGPKVKSDGIVYLVFD